MHSRREDAFKEGLGGIQEELMRTRKHTMRFIIRLQSTYDICPWIMLSVNSRLGSRLASWGNPRHVFCSRHLMTRQRSNTVISLL